MANQNVRFYFGTQAKYDALLEKNPVALYFIEDTQRLYKGETLLAVGTEATVMASGLMSPEDKAKLDAMTVGGLQGLTPVDGTIAVTDVSEGVKGLSVAISTQTGNALTAVEDGLFIPTVILPEYSIEKQEVATEGFAATYKLKKEVNGEVSYLGDAINIAKDLVLKSATLQTVAEANVPFEGAVVGDPYIDMVFNDANATHLYVPMKGLVDTYRAGSGIEIVDNQISVKIATESNGLIAVDGALAIALATKDTAGALSPVDKAFIDSIPTVYASKKYVQATAEQVKYEITDAPLGTLIDYSDNEIRIMCPNDAVFTKQAVGTGGDANSYYVTFKTYAPNDAAVGYIEHLGGNSDSEILTDFSVDEYGRRYQPTWLGIAKLDTTTGVWTYYGKNSTDNKYIGWDYQIDWYNEDGIKIASDSIRINLSNENCHNTNTPYYVSALKAEMNNSMSWGEIE